MYNRYAPSLDFTPDLEHTKVMYDNDATLEFLGATITRVEPGLAEGEFTVEPRHANGFGVCQGGILFTFADALFGGAARERHTWGSNGLSDVTLYDGDTVIAEYRGMSRTTSRPPAGK